MSLTLPNVPCGQNHPPLRSTALEGEAKASLENSGVEISNAEGLAVGSTAVGLSAIHPLRVSSFPVAILYSTAAPFRLPPPNTHFHLLI